jgi:hypothetical protein
MTARVLGVVALLVALAAVVVYGMWLDWDWKAMIGWQTLVKYINPTDATGRRDAVQVYAVIVAGVIATMTAAVGLLNLGLTRKNLEQQRELEGQRAQGTALQAYYEQIGRLITEHKLRSTEHKDIRELARGQTLTVLREVDGNGKGSLLTFLYGAGLIGAKDPAVKPIVALTEADLQEADLQEADLQGADLRGANLMGADLRGANFLLADLERANLQGADLRGANLWEANLRRTRGLNQKQLERAIGGDKTTLLPEGLHPPQIWRKSLEEQLNLARGNQ